MSRVLKRFHGTGSGGAWTDGDKFKLTAGYTPLRDDVDLLLAAVVQRNVWLGGDEVNAKVAEATGDLVLVNWLPWLVDNTSAQISGFTDSPPSGSAATLTAQIRFFLRVSNAAINITPKVWYGSSMGSISTVATISGTAACAATADDYSGTNQIQTVTLTIPSGVKYFKCGFTVAGVPASGYHAWARAVGDIFVALP